MIIVLMKWRSKLSDSSRRLVAFLDVPFKVCVCVCLLLLLCVCIFEFAKAHFCIYIVREECIYSVQNYRTHCSWAHFFYANMLLLLFFFAFVCSFSFCVVNFCLCHAISPFHSNNRLSQYYSICVHKNASSTQLYRFLWLILRRAMLKML